MKKTIILSSLIAVILLYIIEQVLIVDYFVKTGSKLLLFTSIPILFIRLIKKEKLKKAINIEKVELSQIKLGLILGTLAAIVILVSYQIFKPFINFDDIVSDLASKKITASNFIFIAIYISFINAFLEEFFFRGYIFLNLYEIGEKRLAYLYSSLLFAIYHMAIFKTWFNPALILLALVGLIIIGLVFNYIDTKSKNFLNSYLVHILADLGIVFIGFKLLNII